MQVQARGATKHFCLVACWAGGHLGASWGVPGRPWASWGHHGGVPGRPRGGEVQLLVGVARVAMEFVARTSQAAV